MSKAAVYSLLTSDPELISLGFTAETMIRSTGTDSPTARPFGIIAWSEDTPAFANVGSTIVRVWLYDEPGSYDRIDDGISRVRQILTAAVNVSGADGYTLSQAVWAGNSGDEWDDMFKCSTRYAAFTTVSHLTAIQSQ